MALLPKTSCSSATLIENGRRVCRLCDQVGNGSQKYAALILEAEKELESIIENVRPRTFERIAAYDAAVLADTQLDDAVRDAFHACRKYDCSFEGVPVMKIVTFLLKPLQVSAEIENRRRYIVVIGSATCPTDLYGYCSRATPSGKEAVPGSDAPPPETGASPPEDTVSLSGNKGSTEELSNEEKQEVVELKQRDREVKAHEAAHIAAGGGYVRGGATFSYQTGPDGKRYAVGGEVNIDTSTVRGNPEATIRKMQVVRGAALAPADPSGQDRRVAATASAKESKARQELNRQRAEERTEKSGGKGRTIRISSRNGYNRKGGTEPAPDTPQLMDIAA